MPCVHNILRNFLTQSFSSDVIYIYISTNMFLVSMFLKYGHLYIGGTKFGKASVI